MKTNRLVLGALLILMAVVCSGGCCAARAGAGVHVGARGNKTKWIDRCAGPGFAREVDQALTSPVVSVDF